MLGKINAKILGINCVYTFTLDIKGILVDSFN